MRRFSIQPKDIQGATATLYGDEANHIKNVLRMAPGQVIQLLDGTGIEYNAIIRSLSSRQVVAEILEKKVPRTESPIQLILAMALLKEKKMDHLIRPLTELGMTRFIPFVAERSIARPDSGRLAKRIARWEKIAGESLKQCKRSVMPQIGPALSFPELLEFGKSCDLRLLLWENSRTPILEKNHQSRPLETKILLVLGPEGGFSESEVEQAQVADFSVVSIGPRILKAETAPIAACTIIQYLFGDMGNKLLDKDPGIH